MAAPFKGANSAPAFAVRLSPVARRFTPALLLLAASLLAPGAQAFKPGDTVDPAVLEKLGAAPGKITVIDFFAEWCVSCRKELPLLSALHSRSNQKKTDFVGIDTDDNPAAAEAFQKELKARNALSFRVVNDPEQAIVRKFKPRGYPALYIIKDGKVAREHLGAMPDIDAVIEQDLKTLGG